mgnify:CR=1 FL=1
MALLYHGCMADLLTKNELALWTQTSPAVVENDPFAAEVIDKVSQMAAFLGGHDGTKYDAAGALIPEWTLAGTTTAPFDVRMVVLQVCKRCYSNPDQVVQEGSVGPIGGDRVLDAAALLLSLTESERATLTKYNTAGDPDGSTELWTLRISREDAPLSPATIYASDDQQIGMTPDQSAYPSWDIPLFNPGDPGDPNHYV